MIRLATAVAIGLAALAPPRSVDAQQPANSQQTAEETRHIQAEQVGPYRPQQKPELARVAELIVEQVNRLRSKQKQNPVRVDENLQKAAQDFAGYMARTDKYGHTADGKRPADRAKARRYEFCILTENIAYQFRTAGFSSRQLAEAYTSGWEQSPGHRRNMLDPDVTEAGVAVAQSATTGVFYAVQMFGRPDSDTIEFKVVNRSRKAVTYLVGQQKFELPPAYIQTHRLCRAASISLPAAGEEALAATSLKPEAGDTFAIDTSADGKLTLTRMRI
jgi:uncharacterized protein YkwD